MWDIIWAIIKDLLVAIGIDVAAYKATGKEEKKTEKQSFKSTAKRAGANIGLFIVAVVCFLLSVACFFMGFFGYGILFPLGFLITIAYVVYIFKTPYLREKGTYTRWLGFMGIGDIVWWLYAFFIR